MPKPSLTSPWPRIAIVLGLLLAVASRAEAKAPMVLSTIRPITSLAAAVMDGIGRPSTLIPADQAPEPFALRNADADSLRQADVIFWIGASLEAPLAKPFANLEIGARIIELGDTTGLLTYPTRDGREWESSAADGGTPDGHLWLDSDNVKLLIGRIASSLTDVDFTHAEAYRTNAAELRKRVDALDEELAQELTGLRDRPFLVLHDDLQYLEARYNLVGVGSIMVDSAALTPERLKQVAEKVAGLNAVCIVGYSADDDATLKEIAEAAGIRSVRIDLYGATMGDGPDAYFRAMRAMVSQLKSCLGGS
jgi:zinc transport system substrate-binding protein